MAAKLQDGMALATTKNLKVSMQKLNLVAAMIRGKKVEKAMNELQFSRKRIAQDVLKTLKSAVANAENNHNLDIDELYVNEAYVGKNLVLKRWKARARGRVGRIKKPFSQLTVVVKQSENEDSN
ncbi:MAG: 50S ribosomal protein L22 [Rhodobiaceae bacterium]|nr:50S ribosomal protein L22 [Rhodobiaceae bacterium]MAU57120.1 50S ribosomal protein L22 [Rhodobiaceae bacterium]MDC3084939.1 50S ribosomal protein L22 [Gammaproteobacteria bacterium]OUT82764.1 MAG: 50S ribosomal protein L22 [Rhizobiales bacterium TMED28]|tara:strand:- start:5615 stop:5986 length:372 start_codon:yes stop_codon:yes gene_type:complete